MLDKQWTDKSLAYLEPSALRAKKSAENKYTTEELDMIENIIVNHHKVTDFQGPNANVVNAARKADWIDASFGIVRFGMPKDIVGKVSAEIPNAGFHYTLMEVGPRYHGWDVIKIFREISSIFKW